MRRSFRVENLLLDNVLITNSVPENVRITSAVLVRAKISRNPGTILGLLVSVKTAEILIGVEETVQIQILSKMRQLLMSGNVKCGVL